MWSLKKAKLRHKHTIPVWHQNQNFSWKHINFGPEFKMKASAANASFWYNAEMRKTSPNIFSTSYRYSSSFIMYYTKNLGHLFPLPRIQGVNKRMANLTQFTISITFFLRFLEIFGYQQVKTNKNKLSVVS